MLMDFKNKNCYREKIADRVEISDANIPIRLVIEGNSTVMSAEPTLA